MVTVGEAKAEDGSLYFGEPVVIASDRGLCGVGITDDYIVWVDDNTDGNLWSYNINTGKSQPLASGGFDSFFGMPNFSSSSLNDGYICSSGNPFGKITGLRLIKLDGSDIRKLNDTGANRQFIRDGIVYYNMKKDDKGVVYKYDIAKDKAKKLIELDDYFYQFYMTGDFIIIPIGSFNHSPVKIYNISGEFIDEMIYEDDDPDDDVRKSLDVWLAVDNRILYTISENNYTKKEYDRQWYVYDILTKEKTKIDYIDGFRSIGNLNSYSDKIAAFHTSNIDKEKGISDSILCVVDPEREKSFVADKYGKKDITAVNRSITEYVCTWENFAIFTENHKAKYDVFLFDTLAEKKYNITNNPGVYGRPAINDGLIIIPKYDENDIATISAIPIARDKKDLREIGTPAMNEDSLIVTDAKLVTKTDDTPRWPMALGSSVMWQQTHPDLDRLNLFDLRTKDFLNVNYGILENGFSWSNVACDGNIAAYRQFATNEMSKIWVFSHKNGYVTSHFNAAKPDATDVSRPAVFGDSVFFYQERRDKNLNGIYVYDTNKLVYQDTTTSRLFVLDGARVSLFPHDDGLTVWDTRTGAHLISYEGKEIGALEPKTQGDSFEVFDFIGTAKGSVFIKSSTCKANDDGTMKIEEDPKFICHNLKTGKTMEITDGINHSYLFGNTTAYNPELITFFDINKDGNRWITTLDTLNPETGKVETIYLSKPSDSSLINDCQERVSVDGQYVVFMDGDAGNCTIALFDIETGIKRKLTDVGYYFDPSIKNGIISYIAKDDDGYSIYYHQIGKGQIEPIDINESYESWDDFEKPVVLQETTSISGYNFASGDYVMWNRFFTSNTSGLKSYNIKTGIIENISSISKAKVSSYWNGPVYNNTFVYKFVEYVDGNYRNQKSSIHLIGFDGKDMGIVSDTESKYQGDTILIGDSLFFYQSYEDDETRNGVYRYNITDEKLEKIYTINDSSVRLRVCSDSHLSVHATGRVEIISINGELVRTFDAEHDGYFNIIWGHTKDCFVFGKQREDKKTNWVCYNTKTDELFTIESNEKYNQMIGNGIRFNDDAIAFTVITYPDEEKVAQPKIILVDPIAKEEKTLVEFPKTKTHNNLKYHVAIWKNYVVHFSASEENWHLMLYDAKTGETRQLTETKGEYYYPSINDGVLTYVKKDDGLTKLVVQKLFDK